MLSKVSAFFVLTLLSAVSMRAASAFTLKTPSLITSAHTSFPKNSMRIESYNAESFTYRTSSLKMADETPTSNQSDLPMLLDPGTKGGALFLSLVLFIVPILGYEVATIGFGVDGIDAGRWIGVGFTLFTTVLWVGTYIFRVATKDMTYVSKM